jgi:hypothetical protein
MGCYPDEKSAQESPGIHQVCAGRPFRLEYLGQSFKEEVPTYDNPQSSKCDDLSFGIFHHQTDYLTNV